MVRYCSVFGCLETNYSNKNRRFFRFPSDEQSLTTNAHAPTRFGWEDESMDPMVDFDPMAEPDAPVYVMSSAQTVVSRRQSLLRLTSFRVVMADKGVDAYIVPTADAHNSQYIAPTDARRTWLSGLAGSSGTAVVTSTQALVWTDARYFTQFEMQVNTTYWTLMRQGTDQSIQAWLLDNLTSGSVVGVDPTTYTRSAWTPLQTALANANITLQAIDENLVDTARYNIGDPAPSRPNNPLIPLGMSFTGRSSSAKITDLQAHIASRQASALVLTALDDIAYVLNLRGSDIPFNPVFFSYLVLRANANALPDLILFWGNGTLSSEVASHLASEGVQVQPRPYIQIFEYLRNLTTELPAASRIWVSNEASHAVHLAVENNGMNVLATLSQVALMKCIKNSVELAGFRSAHVKDGIAVVRFLRWIHEQVTAGNNVTEIQVSGKLFELRDDEEYFMGPSFTTIAGAGENGAVIHYSPPQDGPQRIIRAEDMLLVDSGGQYRDGTTDITRTRHMSSSPTREQRLAFTRVLKGQIALGAAVFPRGIVGHRLETLARKSLWDVGLDYGHGTGHGVGHFLNVHEGPSWILSGPSATDPGIQAGMIFSNEPGYYEVDEYGIRHEDLMEVITMTQNASHIRSTDLEGVFASVGALAFNTISLAPHQTACLDVNLLDDFEIRYLNEYHTRVLSTLGPILRQRNLTADYDFLEKECEPVRRGAAGLTTSVSLVALFSMFTLWLGA